MNEWVNEWMADGSSEAPEMELIEANQLRRQVRKRRERPSDLRL